MSTAADEIYSLISQNLNNAGAGPALFTGPTAARFEAESVLEPNLASMGFAISAKLTTLARLVADLSETMVSIEESLQNPRSSSAAEAFRKGMHALRRGWYDDAVEEFSRSIDLDRYFAPSHAYAAVARIMLRREAEAVIDLRSAIKYGLEDFPEIAVGAALMGCRIDEESALDFLLSVSGLQGRCPELAVMRYNLFSDPGLLPEALMLAPELVLSLQPPRTAECDLIVSSVASDGRGPCRRAKEISQVMVQANEDLQAVHLPEADSAALDDLQRSSIDLEDDRSAEVRLLTAARIITLFENHRDPWIRQLTSFNHAANSERRADELELNRLKSKLFVEREVGNPLDVFRQKIDLSHQISELETRLTTKKARECDGLVSRLKSLAPERPLRIFPWFGPISTSQGKALGWGI
jgi:hypothetical protein